MSIRPEMLSAAIIAGGKGRRMGGAVKALLEVDGRRIIDRQLEVLRGLAAHVCIAAGDPEPFAGLGVPVIADRIPDSGPVAGIAAALAWSVTPWTLVVAGDMPRLAVPQLKVLLARCGEPVDDSVDIVAISGQPLCAVYARRCAPVLERRLRARDLRASGLLTDEDLRVHLVEREAFAALDPDLTFLTNVNTPGDLLG